MCDGCVTALRDKLASQSDVNNKGFIFKPLTYFFFKHFIVQFFVAGVTVALDLWRFSTTSICGWSQIFERRRSTTYFTLVDESNVVSKPFPVSERYNFFTRLWFWVIRYRIRKRNSLAFRALKNVMSDRDEKKKQNKTEQETESKKLSTKKYGTVWCKKKKWFRRDLKAEPFSQQGSPVNSKWL